MMTIDIAVSFDIWAIQESITPMPCYEAWTPPEPPAPRIMQSTGMGVRCEGFVLQKMPMHQEPCYISRVAFTAGKSYPETFVMQNCKPIADEKPSKPRKPRAKKQDKVIQMPVTLFDRLFTNIFGG